MADRHCLKGCGQQMTPEVVFLLPYVCKHMCTHILESMHVRAHTDTHTQFVEDEDVCLWSQVLGKLRLEDHWSPGAQGQPRQHS